MCKEVFDLFEQYIKVFDLRSLCYLVIYSDCSGALYEPRKSTEFNEKNDERFFSFEDFNDLSNRLTKCIQNNNPYYDYLGDK